ncbi:MAG: DUF4124 domain-containing protein [Acidiferrobacter sp.]
MHGFRSIPALPALLVLVWVAATPAHAETIFKCRDQSGHWTYSEHKPAACHSRLTILKTSPPKKRPTSFFKRPHRRLPSTAQKARWRTEIATWQTTLRQLQNTPIPHDAGEARLRQQALNILNERLARARQRLLADPKKGLSSPRPVRSLKKRP